jgi:hypothetical protein
MRLPNPTASPPRRLALLALLLLLGGCAGPLLDQPGKVRRRQLFLPPFYTSSRSPDGTSYDWSALFWLAGRDVENERRHTRILPFYWRDENPPYSSNTLVLPFYYERRSSIGASHWLSFLYGWEREGDIRRHYVLGPVLYTERSVSEDYHRTGFLLGLFDWTHTGPRDDLVLLAPLGLVTGLRLQRGLPAEGVEVPALGRSGSRRFEVANVLGLVSLFGYDDVGDRREIRLLTFFSSEIFSPIRSWRGRGDDPFVSEWVFPLYMNRQDTHGGWFYVGPFWGRTIDRPAERQTDWWLLGLLARTRAPEGNTWRVLGLPIISP